MTFTFTIWEILAAWFLAGVVLTVCDVIDILIQRHMHSRRRTWT